MLLCLTPGPARLKGTEKADFSEKGQEVQGKNDSYLAAAINMTATTTREFRF